MVEKGDRLTDVSLFVYAESHVTSIFKRNTEYHINLYRSCFSTIQFYISPLFIVFVLRITNEWDIDGVHVVFQSVISIEVELSTSRLCSHVINLDDRTLLMGKRTMSFEMKYWPFQRLSFRLDEDGVILLPKSLAGQASVATE